MTMSAWAKRRFGSDAETVAASIIDGLQAAHERAVAAHDAGGLSTADAYGSTLWLAAAQEIADRIKEVEGSTQIKPTRSRYTLGVVQDQVILPLRIGSDLRTPPDEARVQMSRVRSDLFNLGPRPIPIDTTGSLYTEDLTPEPTMLVTSEDPQEFDRHNLVVAAYVSSTDGGLAGAWWGEAALKSDGHLDWRHREPLDLTTPTIVHVTGRPALHLVREDSPAVQSFSDAPLEETSLGLRPALGASPEGESTKEPNLPDAATGSGSDDE